LASISADIHLSFFFRSDVEYLLEIFKAKRDLIVETVVTIIEGAILFVHIDQK
jgi:hypothetical protein